MSGVVVVPLGQSEVVSRRFGELTVVKAAEAETRGAYAVRENTAPAGSGQVPWHRHLGAEEAFYVLEGELTVFAEDRTLALPAGGSRWSRAARCTRSPTGARCRCGGSR